MPKSYMERGYNDPGYVEGDSGGEIEFSEGIVTLKHFVSNGSKNKQELVSAVQSKLAGERELAILYIPEAKTMALVSKIGFMDFLSTAPALDVQATATVVAADGTVLATPKVTSTDKYKMTFEIDETLAGGSYFVTLDISTCADCRQGE